VQSDLFRSTVLSYLLRNRELPLKGEEDKCSLLTEEFRDELFASSRDFHELPFAPKHEKWRERLDGPKLAKFREKQSRGFMEATAPLKRLTSRRCRNPELFQLARPLACRA
jgi:hypothetical protein